MDDFLYNVRTGNMRNMDKSRRYDNNRYKQQNRQPNKDRRKGYVNYRSLSTDQFSVFKDFLGKMAENQERQAVAMEKIAESLQQLIATPKGPVAPEPRTPPPMPDHTVETASDPEPSVAQPINRTEIDRTKMDRTKMVALVHELREQGLSYEKIADVFESKQISTLSGRGKWRGQTIYRLFNES